MFGRNLLFNVLDLLLFVSMALFNTLLVLLLVQLFSQFSHGHPKPEFFRKDYTFIKESQALYKVHMTRKAFHDARKQCQTEGSILFYPENDVEAETVMGLWNRTEPYGWIYLGITDLMVKGAWETVDGRPLLDVYSNWGAGQPDDTGGIEDCVLWRRDKTLIDYTCHEEYPFICKKSLLSLDSITIGESNPSVQSKPRFNCKDYTYIKESQAFYKVHTIRKAFHDARKQCQTEGAILFYPENDVEAETVMGLWNKTEPYGWIYLGVTDLRERGFWETVDGQPLQDVYSNWGAGQPDDTGGIEDCVLWRRDKTLNDYTCHEEYPFICKKSLLSLDSNTIGESNPSVQSKPRFNCKDYTYIKESQAFYKVHTTRKAFHDARKQCQTEGAILFYPENDVEAETVMGLWNKTEPYGWIYLGVTDLMEKGVWETVDGRPLLDVYSNWGAGQPDDTGGIADCVLWRRDKTLNDYTCYEEYPFICKKSLLSLDSNKIGGSNPSKTDPSVQSKPSLNCKDYTYIKESQALYKVHTIRKAFHDARKQCQTEGAILFYPENDVEAEIVMGLWNKTEPYGWIYVGVTDLMEKGVWETVDGRPLLDVYSNWGAGQPDDTGGVEDCVLWRRDKTLNDYTCHEEYPFICKQSLLSLDSNKLGASNPSVQSQPSLNCKDYTYIKESQALYKVHTIRKAFHDARKQCQTEGAILFYPENDVEAETVMGLWNKTEPYGWIYLGITDLMEKGVWETVDGRPLLEVYSNWSAGQPDDTGGIEDCVLWRRDKTLNDYTCHEEYPFICKKSLLSLDSNTIGESNPDPSVQSKPWFNCKDYTYIKESQAFYKVHTTRKAFHDARKQCQTEGAILFYPENDVEAETVMGLWNKTEPYGWIYLGVTDLMEKGVWETVDGRPLLDVYSNWGAGQPDDTGGIEDCVLWRRDKTLNDYTCYEEYPFICKKSLLSLDSNKIGGSNPSVQSKPSLNCKDYTYIKESQALYKVHTIRKAFHDARKQCQTEGAILFYPENDVEAEIVMGLWNKTEPYGWIYVGVTDLMEKGVWETVDGRPLLDVYSNWGAGQPDDTGGVEDCVLWRRDKTLNDYTCHEEYPFICKKSLLSLDSNKLGASNPSVQSKPWFNCKDYTYIKESQAFYKVHTTRKAFHDARKQCQTEGAILFYPENDVEAETVMGLWNKTEPYGWIYLGVTDLMEKGVWETVDGRPLLDVYSNWGAGQPDDTGGIEDCVLWRRDKTLNDYTCYEEYPFICKKSLLSLDSNKIDRSNPSVQSKPWFNCKDYTYIKESQALYKVHTIRKAFHDARKQCQTEGAILFYPENDVEAEIVMGLWNKTEPYGWIYVGVTDLMEKGVWETVDGRPLLDVYSNWGAGQPDDTGGVEDCVLWRRDKTLNDYTCHEEYPFICKKSLLSLDSNKLGASNPSVQSQPSLNCKDYTYIKESQALYKVHTIRKAFHDARKQCQTEGAILFYPENDVEAETVIGLWNKTEPYGWIYLGITDLMEKGVWETVDGRPLLEVYSNWGAGQPDDTGGIEDCVLWRRDKTLNDYTCHEEYPFICKKSLLSLDSKTIGESNPDPSVQSKPWFNCKDYTYIKESQAFYKVHTTRKAFHDARKQCQIEGAILFYPENDFEAETVMGLWNKTEPYGWIYLGVTDLIEKGVWETVDGRPLLDVYSNWGAGQPDDTGGIEDCVLWRRDKTLNDYTCYEEYPFICKKSLLSLDSNKIGGSNPSKTDPSVQSTPSLNCKDYTYIKESQALYKVHTIRKAFHDARKQCQTEGAILFYPENDVEAEIVMGLWNKTEPYGWIYVGVTDLMEKGVWETVDGRPLLDVYSNWGAGQPDDTGGVEDCVLWRRDKTLNDYTCHEEYPFICKKSLLSLDSNKLGASNPSVQSKPWFNCKDYTYIKESQAFYKVHTTRKAFHDARKQCQTEGAILFYPENDVEAETVMGLWNKTEPYGWIYLGVTDLMEKGVWETVDGRPLLDVYSNWGAGQPDDTGGIEDCVLWRRDKTLNDYTCYEEYPFICKKSLLSLDSNKIGGSNPSVQSKPSFNCKDYTYIKESQALYKVHTTRKAFHDARKQCQIEGAILFYPENDFEAETVMGLWNKTEPYGWIYLGVTDLIEKGVWETVDGRPLLDVYSNWGAGQPDDTGGIEDCVLWRRDKTLNDYTCHEEYPFICKKSLLSLDSNKIGGSNPSVQSKPSLNCKDYTYIKESQALYIVHTIRKAFHDARKQCQTEGAILFYPENDVEAEIVMGLWNKTEPYGWIYLGVTDLMEKGVWETVDGRPLLDVYSNWGAGQPDDTGGIEDCVLWRRDKTLNDYTCHEEYPFICKKSLLSLDSNKIGRSNPSVQSKPSFNCKDYTYIKESQALYKVHTTRKAFHDARKQCQIEGAILFYPENDVEAETVMGLWNKTEPYGWIYLGVTDLIDKGVWETVDGRPLLDVYSNWGAGQPDDTGGIEDCVLWRRDKTLNDYTCHEEYPFICKKKMHNLDSNTIYNMPDAPLVSIKQPKSKFFRRDYTFVEESQAFYKIHTIHRTWHDARRRCQMESSSLFYPEDDVEAEAVMGFWNRTQPFRWIYLGISDLLSKGNWETIDGRPLLDVYNNWGADQPDETGNIEDCVLWRRDKTLNDYRCDEKYPFICKKSLHKLNWNTLCNMPDQAYHYSKDFGKCYKFHLTPMNWTDAYAVCSAEQSYLAIINSRSEADYLAKITEEAPKHKIKGNFLSGAVYLGYHNKNNDGWETVKGTSLEDTGYTGWGNQQPDGGDKETCGSMFYNGRLNDLGCSHRCFFICEHDIGLLGNAVDERFGRPKEKKFDEK